MVATCPAIVVRGRLCGVHLFPSFRSLHVPLGISGVGTPGDRVGGPAGIRKATASKPSGPQLILSPAVGLEVVTGSPRDTGLDSQAERRRQTLAWQPLTPFPPNWQRWTSAHGPTVGAVSSGASTPWAATNAAVTLGMSWPRTSAAARVSAPTQPPGPDPLAQIS